MAFDPDGLRGDGLSVPIIGTGFCGPCMGIRLKQPGFGDFTVLEGAAVVGGSWRDNHYPACACGVQSHLYSFASFAPNRRWARIFARQPENKAYLHDYPRAHLTRAHKI